MIDDFQPPKRRKAQSLQATLDTLKGVNMPAKASKTNTPSFRTPEEVAAAQTVGAPTIVKPTVGAAQPTKTFSATSDSAQSESVGPITGAQPSGGKPNPLQALWHKLDLSWPPGQKELIIIGVSLIIITGIVSAVLLTHNSSKPLATAHKVVKVKKLPPKPTTVPSTLSGLLVDPTVNARPVTGVMIENSTDARPQSGLSQASVVFEAIAEGGITRFLALYQDTAPDNVGPIRSARPYYIEWNLGFDAAYAHVGGSPEGLADIKTWGVKDLDQFANGGSYHRISTRAAPHNVYTAISTLNQLETAKGYTTSTFTGFTRKVAAPAKVPTAKTINIAISGPLYDTHYDYVATTNNYTRSEGGALHIDANTNLPISPSVIVAMVMPYGLEADDHHSQYGTIGTGAAYVFQDGNVTVGSWTKTTDKSQFTFADSAGKPLAFNPGQTWLTAVATAGAVTYTP